MFESLRLTLNTRCCLGLNEIICPFQLTDFNGRQKDFYSFPPEIKLRLEAFARAIMQEVQEKSLDLRTKFIELGLQFGKEWFYDKDSPAVKEQRFITDKIRNGKM